MEGVTIVYFLLVLLNVVPLLAQDASENEALIIPKSYSNLKLPTRKRGHKVFAEEEGGGGGGPSSDEEEYFAPPQGPRLMAPAPPRGTLVMSTAPAPPRVFMSPAAAPPDQDANSTLAPPDEDPNSTSAPPDEDPNLTLAPPTLQPYSGVIVKLDSETESIKKFAFSGDEGEEDGEEEEKVNVDVAIQIQSIREVDEEDQKITVEMDLTVHWHDYDFLPEQQNYWPEKFENISSLFRTFGGVPLPLEDFDKLWKPDIFIERVVKVTKPGLLSSPVTVRAIKRTSSIVYTTRASVKTDCSMDFQYYPADTQHCIIDIRSYQNDETKMNLRWNPSPGAYLVETDSDDNFDAKLSYVAQRRKKVKDINLDDAIFDVLQIQLSMRRRMTYHILQTYIPSAFLVFITWLSFLIPEDLIEARIGISMTTLLTLTAMFSAVRESTPVVSYIKAIDIWMVYCIFIVFATLLEFAFFVWLRNYKIAQRQRKLENLICEVELNGSGKNGGKNSFSEPIGRARHSLDEFSTKAVQTFERTAKLINQFTFGFFVSNFVVFNIVYWTWLSLSSGHSQWVVNATLNGQPNDTNGGFVDEL